MQCEPVIDAAITVAATPMFSTPEDASRYLSAGDYTVFASRLAEMYDSICKLADAIDRQIYKPVDLMNHHEKNIFKEVIPALIIVNADTSLTGKTSSAVLDRMRRGRRRMPRQTAKQHLAQFQRDYGPLERFIPRTGKKDEDPE
jgi:hypothetical protein